LQLAIRPQGPALFGGVKKQALIRRIVSRLASDLETCIKAAYAARFEATHEQSKAESKYDTRGLEASYLARGQSKQAAELMQAIEAFEALPPRTFSADDGIDVGALVELETNGARTFYFIGPRAGGTEVQHETKEVIVLTPQSPLGQQLAGKKQGDTLQIELAGTRSTYHVLSVS
jgi:transcription elongation GreA/GreB family factor